MKNTNSAAESGAFVRKTRGYSVVQNEALFNDSLSMSAKGLYALIAARIDYTAVPLTKQWLMNHCTEGERAFNRAWDMLKNNGYSIYSKFVPSFRMDSMIAFVFSTAA